MKSTGMLLSLDTALVGLCMQALVLYVWLEAQECPGTAGTPSPLHRDWIQALES